MLFEIITIPKPCKLLQKRSKMTTKTCFKTEITAEINAEYVGVDIIFTAAPTNYMEFHISNIRMLKNFKASSDCKTTGAQPDSFLLVIPRWSDNLNETMPL